MRHRARRGRGRESGAHGERARSCAGDRGRCGRSLRSVDFWERARAGEKRRGRSRAAEGRVAETSVKYSGCGTRALRALRRRARGARDIQANVQITLDDVRRGVSREINIPETVTNVRGKRETQPAREVKVDIPKGVEDGQRLRVAGEGIRGVGGRVGSLYINVQVRMDPRFRRVGSDLVTSIDIPFPTAALGGTVKAPTMDGEVEVKVRKATQHGDQLRLRGRGLPVLGTALVGDLFVRFSVSTPANLSPRQEELLKEFAEEETRKNAPAPQADDDDSPNSRAA